MADNIYLLSCPSVVPFTGRDAPPRRKTVVLLSGREESLIVYRRRCRNRGIKLVSGASSPVTPGEQIHPRVLCIFTSEIIPSYQSQRSEGAVIVILSPLFWFLFLEL